MAARVPVVELLWFSDCPNHQAARALLRELVVSHGGAGVIVDIDATDPVVAASHRFPGSPTIRVNGVDVDPSFIDPGDYTPRCRLYRTEAGLRGVPDASWIRDALISVA
jgi:hypothetical protein